MNNSIRIEEDSLGSVEVPSNALWGAQTQRSLTNFAIGEEIIPFRLIYALAEIKKAAAIANHNLGVIDEHRKNLIIKAASEITQGIHNNHFP